MTKTLDADQILQHAAPLQGQRAHEIQPFGHIVKMPIALEESVCEESVENLNQLLADTMTLRDAGLPPRNSCDDSRGDLDRAGFRPLR